MTKLARYLRSLLCRKPTTVVHLGCGALVAVLLSGERWLLGLTLFAGFAVFEYWECRDTGHADFWEMLAGMFIAAACLALGGMIR